MNNTCKVPEKVPGSMLKEHGQLTVSVTQLLSSLTHCSLGAQTDFTDRNHF